MTDTASPSLSQQLGFAAKVIRLLEDAGLTHYDFTRIQQDAAVRQSVVAVFHPRAQRTPILGEVASLRLYVILDAITPISNYLDSAQLAEVYARFTSDDGFGSLYNKLGEQSRSVLVHAYGLDGLTSQGDYDIGYELEINATEVTDIKRRALVTIREELLHQLLKTNKDVLVGILGFSTNLCSKLESHGIITVGDLTGRTFDTVLSLSLTFPNTTWRNAILRARDSYNLGFRQP